jgi:hypothetical protein
VPRSGATAWVISSVDRLPKSGIFVAYSLGNSATAARLTLDQVI